MSSRVVALLAVCLVVSCALVAYKLHRRRMRNRPPPTQRELVQAAITARPQDPWPRGEGHVLLAFPGTREHDKGYHEPGGSFSPTVGSFGLAIWLADADGKLIASSDSIPLSELKQHLEPSVEPTLPPVLVTETPYYVARWSAVKPGRFSLQVTPITGKAQELVIMVRSVGPAGGPIKHLEYSDKKLRVSHRWGLELSSRPRDAKLAAEPLEPDPNWMLPSRQGASSASVTSRSGWAYARLGFSGDLPLTVVVQDERPFPALELADITIQPRIVMNLPDARFVDSLHAQTSHLLMSLVGTEARPGEPINYPLPWLRDGAYTAVALARAGHPELSRRMVKQFAEHDFFGGFGSEGDANGFALWVMDEIAERAQDPALDAYLYPHAYRKAEFIKLMMEATQTIRVNPVQGPIVPVLRDDPKMAPDIDLVCDKAQNGLIIGRMDGHRPVLFINAVNYMGLRRAARIAERVGDTVTAKRWRDRASKLRAAWRQGFDTEERNNDRTAISTLWPSFVGHDAREKFGKLLEERWDAQRNPDGSYTSVREWTYFDAAEMHNWMVLGRPDKTWQTLEYYWAKQQSSPGLYTWSEGTGEENSFGLWKNVRGWVAPRHVTPHYWSASEMLLLQIEMLAYVEESEDAPSYVIGGGIPKQWLAQPLSVKGVGTSRGSVDWSWSNGKLQVTVHGEKLPVRAGPELGNIAVDVQYAEAAHAAE